MNLFLLLAGIFLGTFLFGTLLERIRVPWIFGALITGLLFASIPSLRIFGNAEILTFLAWLGMYFLLFLIGLELNLEKIKKIGKFIARSTFFIIFFEAFWGSLLIHYIFHFSWFVSVLVALSFATVGEAVLVPILDEFKLIKNKLGQTILSIGTFDDIIEVLVIVIAVLTVTFMSGSSEINAAINHILLIFALLFVLILLLVVSIKLKNKISFFHSKKLEINFILVLTILFLSLGITYSVDMLAIGAIFAGILVRNLLGKQKFSLVENKIKTLTYDFFGPIFFFWVGLGTDIKFLTKSPLLILLVIFVSYGSKVFSSWLIGRRELGNHRAIFMGISLSVRFSTSIVIIKYLFENNIINLQIYSILIASTIVSIFIPFILSWYIKKYKI